MNENEEFQKSDSKIWNDKQLVFFTFKVDLNSNFYKLSEAFEAKLKGLRNKIIFFKDSSSFQCRQLDTWHLGGSEIESNLIQVTFRRFQLALCLKSPNLYLVEGLEFKI